uniref:kelch domain-containing protein 8A-like n=1 Tax=Myxine glutinosa TaxID=7769 RepID=UPI00358E7959
MASVSKSKAFHWEILPALPTRRVYCTLVACGDLLYVLGGCDAVGNPLDCVEAWPLEGGRTWERLPPMPTARAGVGAVAMGKLVFALGGVGLYHRPVPAVEAYGADHKCWSSRSQIPEAIMGMAIAVRDCRLYLAGGMTNDTSPLSSLWEYDALHDEWKALPPMPTSRYGAVACIRGNLLYILGGRQCKQTITALESFDLDTQTWTCLPSMTSKRAFSGYVSTDNCIYSLGGLERPSLRNYHLRPTFVSTVEFFDIQQGIWLKSSKVPHMKKKRADFVAACLGGRVVVVGGLGNQPKPLGLVEALHPVKNRWELLPSMPTPRCSCSSLRVRNKLYVVGGVSRGPSDAAEVLTVVDEADA